MNLSLSPSHSLVVLGLLASPALCQGFGEQRELADGEARPTSIYATDLDGDGDLDVLSASRDGGQITSYQNLGDGTFERLEIITTEADGARSVFATDLDGDGDADVLSASQYDDKIAWYENLGGGAFGAQQVITTSADNAISVFATDLDRDGDADVLSASLYDNNIAWYENLGGGAFGAQQVITTQADSATSVYATDLDGDGDAEVLSASSGDDKIAWYENLMGPPVGANYCGPSNLNSSGQPAVLSAYGSIHVASNALRLAAANTATNQFAMFLNSRTQGLVVPPGSQGYLCLGGAIGRYKTDIMNTGAAGTAELQLDLTTTPTPNGPVAIQPGETWNFQLWFRDSNPGPTSNFTDGVSITFD